MNTNTFAERLNICLDKEGFPPKNHGRIQLLAEMVGLTHRGASKWVNGQSCPPAGKYASLAKKLNVSELWLRTGAGPMSTKKIPHKTITCVLPYKGNFFGITLETEAMSPRFPNGSIIIFDDEALSKDGDFVLVSYAGLPEPIFRQLLTMGSSRYLNAHNPKFDRLTLTDESRIMGKLVQAILSFE